MEAKKIKKKALAELARAKKVGPFKTC